MTLKQYMDKFDFSYRQLAQVLEVDASTIHKWVTGERHPSLKNALKIQEKTRGRVTVEGLCKK